MLWSAMEGEVVARFGKGDELRGAEFVGVDLRGARFVEADLSGVVMRGVEMREVDIDAPWIAHGESFFRVNGVDVTAFVEGELDRRFPGRAERRAVDPDGLRAAWGAVERAWGAVLERVAGMPNGTVDVSVDGEWSFAQTLRHLVHATDLWFGKAVLQVEEPFHPLGQPYDDRELGGSVAATSTPPYGEVLEARAGRVAMVRDYIATVTPEVLDAECTNPHNPDHPETVRSCLHVILEEEWEHQRFAVRDLDTIEARG
ncbi:DinB family protein [Kribbella sp. NPDC050820]|uniref:DinB family protein n=1 Tax=Kribbella sp. NPDC050820 TaxID=3155408 RepID=UPI0033E0BEB6